MADPLALRVADAAARAVEFVGLPEAALNLAQAVVHLAPAPKSNASTWALNRALEDVRNRPVGEVPAHLRDAPYRARPGSATARATTTLTTPPGLGRPAVPPRRAGRRRVLRAVRPRRRGAPGGHAGASAAASDPRRTPRAERRQWVVMSALDLLAVLVRRAPSPPRSALSVLSVAPAARRSALEPRPRRSRTRRIPAVAELRRRGTRPRRRGRADRRPARRRRRPSATGSTPPPRPPTGRSPRPVIKGVAFASGTRRAAQRLRRQGPGVSHVAVASRRTGADGDRRD